MEAAGLSLDRVTFRVERGVDHPIYAFMVADLLIMECPDLPPPNWWGTDLCEPRPAADHPHHIGPVQCSPMPMAVTADQSQGLIAGDDIPPGWPVSIGADGKVYPATPVPPEWKRWMEGLRAYNQHMSRVADILNGADDDAPADPTGGSWRTRPPML